MTERESLLAEQKEKHRALSAMEEDLQDVRTSVDYQLSTRNPSILRSVAYSLCFLSRIFFSYFEEIRRDGSSSLQSHSLLAICGCPSFDQEQSQFLERKSS